MSRNFRVLQLTSYSPVGALNPYRYSLSDSSNYPLQGILHVRPRGPPTTTTRDLCTTSNRNWRRVKYGHAARGENRATQEPVRQQNWLLVYALARHLDGTQLVLPSSRIGSFELPLAHVKGEKEADVGAFDENARTSIGSWRRDSRVSSGIVYAWAALMELLTGCEGAEGMLPALDTLFELSA